MFSLKDSAHFNCNRTSHLYPSGTRSNVQICGYKLFFTFSAAKCKLLQNELFESSVTGSVWPSQVPSNYFLPGQVSEKDPQSFRASWRCRHDAYDTKFAVFVLSWFCGLYTLKLQLCYEAHRSRGSGLIWAKWGSISTIQGFCFLSQSEIRPPLLKLNPLLRATMVGAAFIFVIVPKSY